MNIFIVSENKRLARMLFLEINKHFENIKVINERLTVPALKLSLQNCDCLVFDSEYYMGNISFLKEIKIPIFLLTKENVDVENANVKHVFTRPFAVDEFVKIFSEQNGSHTMNTKENISTKVDNIKLDYYSMQADIDGNIIKFSPKEFALLSLLYKNRGKVLSRKFVLDSVWGNDYDNTNNVDNVYINYLRKKLDNASGVKLIYTIRNQGYMMK